MKRGVFRIPWSAEALGRRNHITDLRLANKGV